MDEKNEIEIEVKSLNPNVSGSGDDGGKVMPNNENVEDENSKPEIKEEDESESNNEGKKKAERPVFLNINEESKIEMIDSFVKPFVQDIVITAIQEISREKSFSFSQNQDHKESKSESEAFQPETFKKDEESEDAENEIIAKESKDLKAQQEESIELSSTVDIDCQTIDLCLVCGSPANFKCKNCKTASYCSKEHQTSHWKTHKMSCNRTFVKTKKCPESNREELISTTKIKEGVVIMVEDPLFIGPWNEKSLVSILYEKYYDAVANKENNIDEVVKDEILQKFFEINKPFCVGCYLEMEHYFPYMDCEICGWPLCTMDCEAAHIHYNWECTFLKENEINFEEVMKNYTICPKTFSVFRFLLLARLRPRIWENFPFFDNNDENSACTKKDIIAQYVLKNAFKLDITVNQLKYILRIFSKYGYNQIKSFQMDALGRPVMMYQKFIYLFSKASQITHSCFPNSTYRLAQNDPMTRSCDNLSLISLRPIKNEELITVNRIENEDIECTMSRRQQLLQRFRIYCKCERCIDPSEFGTCMSGIACLKCKRREVEAYYLSTDSLDDKAVWKCQKCKATKSASCIQKIMTEVNEFTKSLNIRRAGFYQLLSQSEKINHAISKYQQTVLHPNHSFFLNLEYELIKESIYRSEFRDDIDWDYLISLLRKRASILDKIMPKRNSQRMLTNLYLIEAIQRKSLLNKENLSLEDFNFAKSTFEDIRGYIKANPHLSDSYFIKIFRSIQSNFYEIDILRNSLKKLNKKKQSSQQPNC